MTNKLYDDMIVTTDNYFRDISLFIKLKDPKTCEWIDSMWLMTEDKFKEALKELVKLQNSMEILKIHKKPMTDLFECMVGRYR